MRGLGTALLAGVGCRAASLRARVARGVWRRNARLGEIRRRSNLFCTATAMRLRLPFPDERTTCHGCLRLRFSEAATCHGEMAARPYAARGTRARVRRAAAHRPSKTTTSTPRPDSEQGTHLLTTAVEWGHADAAGSPSTASPLHFDRHWPADALRLFAIDAGAEALAQGKVAGRALVVARDICESGRRSWAGGRCRQRRGSRKRWCSWRCGRCGRKGGQGRRPHVPLGM